MFSILLIAAGVLLNFVSAQTQDCTRNYTVQEGDICDSISAANNASTYQLAVLNPSINSGCTNLMAGQVLCLGVADQDCNQTYVVVSGDTCDGVAAAAGVNETIFAQNNPQLDSYCDNLYIGEVVAVCGTVLAPPTPSGTMPATAIPPTGSPASPWCD